MCIDSYVFRVGHRQSAYIRQCLGVVQANLFQASFRLQGFNLREISGVRIPSNQSLGLKTVF